MSDVDINDSICDRLTAAKIDLSFAIRRAISKEDELLVENLFPKRRLEKLICI